MSDYHAYEMRFPATRPYDLETTRWATFIGEFVRPIVQQHPDLLYWTSYYTNHAEFKTLTDDIGKLQPHLDTLRKCGFIVNDLNRTLEEDLGGGRFFGPDSRSTPTQRARLILQSLKSVSDLLVDSVCKRDDGYWSQEQTGDNNQNPIGNHFFSVLHLHHNISATNALIYPFVTPDNGLHLLSYYYYENYKHKIGPHTAYPPQEVSL